MLGNLETIQPPAKRGFICPHPFVTEHAETCIIPGLWRAASGSYPSRHFALGWAWALIMSEMAPDRADEILARGLAYGESRAICGVHYASEAGRIVGACRVCQPQGRSGLPSGFRVGASGIGQGQKRDPLAEPVTPLLRKRGSRSLSEGRAISISVLLEIDHERFCHRPASGRVVLRADRH